MLVVKIIWFIFSFFMMSIVYGTICEIIFPDLIKNKLHLIVIGTVTFWAVFYVLSVPMIFAKCTMNCCTVVVCTITALIALFAIWHKKNKRDVSAIRSIRICKLDKVEILLLVLICFFIVKQLYGYLFLQHSDADDAEFVVYATSAVQNNEMLTLNPLAGFPIEKSMFVKRAMNPFVILIAFYSKIADIHPSIMSHTVVPPILLVIAYGVYWMISEKFFKRRFERLLFLLFIAIIHTYGYTSVYTNSSFFLLRLWQGKAVLSALIIPYIACMCLGYSYKSKKETVGMLFIAGLAGTLTSPISYVVIPIEIMSYFIGQTIAKRRVSILYDGVIACLPSLICGVVFFVLMYSTGVL